MGKRIEAAEKIKNAICERIANGEPLRAICREEGMPGWVTVYNWINEDQQFAEHFARARDLGADAIAEEALEIADDARNDWMKKQTPGGVVTVLDAEHVQRSKLRIETRLKLLAKWNPKKYGDKLELGGKVDGGFALVIQPRKEAA